MHGSRRLPRRRFQATVFVVAALCAWTTQAVLRSAPQSNSGPSVPAVTASAALSLPLLGGGTTASHQAGIEGGPASGDCAPTDLPTASPDLSLDSVFSDQQGPGWLGGDATYSTALPNGQEAFVFSDTLIGTAQPSGAASLTGVPHNSELSGALPDLSDELRGSNASPQALIPDPTRQGAAWQVASTYMENGDQLIFVNEFTPVNGSLFDDYTGRSGIAIMSLTSGKPTPYFIVLVPTDSDTQWGNALMQSGGYDYIYGLSMDNTTDKFYGMKVARVPVGTSLDTSQWTYWNGAGWVLGESNAVAAPGFPLITGVVPLQDGSGFMGIGVDGSAGEPMAVALTFSCTPTGPWSTPRNVYSIPQTTEYPDEYAYIATFHPELAGNGLVASYNIDSLNGLNALKDDDHRYQPHFITLSG